MACEKCFMSCSLCPYALSDECPRATEMSEYDKKYWVFILNRNDSCYDVLLKTDDLDETITFIDNLRNKKEWDKKYLYSIILGKKVRNRYPEAKVIDFPYIELTVTNGYCNWENKINLVLNLNDNMLYYYDVYESHIKYEQKVVITGPWENQLNFKREDYKEEKTA